MFNTIGLQQFDLQQTNDLQQMASNTDLQQIDLQQFDLLNFDLQNQAQSQGHPTMFWGEGVGGDMETHT
jgi:hypothetical protein